MVASPCGSPQDNPKRLNSPSRDTNLAAPAAIQPRALRSTPERQLSARLPQPAATMDGEAQKPGSRGVTNVLSEAKPTPKDLQLNESLVEFLKSINNFETPEGNDRRCDAAR